jgi:GH43 family beta-xylosidase
MSGYIWAPELHRIDGKWYSYYAGGEAPSMWNIHMYVLENAAADPFTGKWVEKGMIKMNWDSFTLDATTFEHKGTRYLVWAQSLAGQNATNIYIAKMDTPWSIQGEQILLSKPELDWERRGGVQVNEGPAVLIRNGRVFIAYSASATDANYCLGLLTADENANLLDPKSWSKSPEPVFVSSPENGLFGPGHNSFTTTPDGKQDIMFYHARTYAKIRGDPLTNPDRGTRAQYVGWKPDGTPDFGPPLKDGPVQPPPTKP